MTIRQMYQLFENDPQFLDAELQIQVKANGKVAYGTMPRDLWGFPRIPAYPQTNEPARITMQIHLDEGYVIQDRRKRISG